VSTKTTVQVSNISCWSDVCVYAFIHVFFQELKLSSEHDTMCAVDTEPCPKVLSQGPEARAGCWATTDVPEAPLRHTAAAELSGR
jgi:hypothetical protein